MSNKNSYLNNDRGFTFIELIIYISIVSIFIVGLVNFALIINRMYAKSRVQENVNYSARYSSERIKYEIRNSSGINAGDSDFGVNLSDTDNSKISLISGDGSGSVLLRVTGGLLQISYNGVDFSDISDSNCKIVSLIFQDYSTPDGQSKNVSFIMITEPVNTGGGTVYQDSVSVRSGAEIRNN